MENTENLYDKYTTEESSKLMITLLTLENGGELGESTSALLLELEKREKEGK